MKLKWKQPKVVFAILVLVLVLMVSAISVVCIDMWNTKTKLDKLYWVAENTQSGMVYAFIERAELVLRQRLIVLGLLAVATTLTAILTIMSFRSIKQKQTSKVRTHASRA